MKGWKGMKVNINKTKVMIIGVPFML